MVKYFFKVASKPVKFFYFLLLLAFFVSCFLMLPFCRKFIIDSVEFFLHKNLSFVFWNRVIFYVLITISSFSFYWLLSSYFSSYVKSDKFDLKQTLIIVSCFLFFLSLIVQSVLLYNGIVYGGDDPAYVIIAKAMAEGKYKADFSSMKNSNMCLQYTVGYPGLLAIAYKIFGMNFYAMKFVNVFLYAIFVVVLFNFLFSLVKDIQISLFISSLFCLNFTISNWQNRTMSDTTCMVFCLLSLALIYSIYFSNSKYKYFKSVLLGFCFFIAYESRINGLVCILSLFSVQILFCIFRILKNLTIFYELQNSYSKVNWKIHIIPYIVFIVLLTIQMIIYPSLPRQDSFYVADFSLSTFFGNFILFYVMYEFFNSAWNEVFHQFNILSKIAFYLSILLALYGLIKNWKKSFLFFFFAFGMTIIYCLWNGFGGIRFYFPLFIAIAVFCAYGAKSIKDYLYYEKKYKVFSFLGKFLVIFFCAMFTISIFPFYTTQFKTEIEKNGHSYSAEAKDIWNYINENIPDDKTFIFRSPRELWLYTKHKTSTCNQKTDYYLHSLEKPIDDELKNLLSDEIVSQNQIEIDEKLFELEYRNDRFLLFHAL